MPISGCPPRSQKPNHILNLRLRLSPGLDRTQQSTPETFERVRRTGPDGAVMHLVRPDLTQQSNPVLHDSSTPFFRTSISSFLDPSSAEPVFPLDLADSARRTNYRTLEGANLTSFDTSGPT